MYLEIMKIDSYWGDRTDILAQTGAPILIHRSPCAGAIERLLTSVPAGALTFPGLLTLIIKTYNFRGDLTIFFGYFDPEKIFLK